MNKIPRITHNAVRRVREHHPDADVDAVLAMLDRSILIEQGEAAGMICRPLDWMRDEYRLAPDRRGLFIVVTNPHHCREGETVRIVVEYSRFGPGQTAKAWELWPLDSAVVADVREAA